jgi:hypothetical protein
MNNITAIWTADHGIAMPSVRCAVSAHAAAHRVRGAVDLQVLTAKPTFGTGHRPWSPPIT